MSEFINTADVIGDDELCDQIIMRTVTEYRESRITKVGARAFNYCTKLAVVDVPNVTNVAGYGFGYCTALTKITLPSAKTLEGNAFDNSINILTIDLPVVTQLKGRTFNGRQKLAHLLIRTPSVCTMADGNCFYSPYPNLATVYIYVPSALIDSYKVATNWSKYANNFRALEDYTVDGTITGDLDESKI